MNNQFTVENYNGYEISTAADNSTNSVVISKDGQFVKGIAGDIAADGSNNKMEKAKAFIDQLCAS